MNESKKLVVINNFSTCESYILALNESQNKLLDFLFDNDIINTDIIGYTTNVIDAIEKV